MAHNLEFKGSIQVHYYVGELKVFLPSWRQKWVREIFFLQNVFPLSHFEILFGSGTIVFFKGLTSQQFRNKPFSLQTFGLKTFLKRVFSFSKKTNTFGSQHQLRFKHEVFFWPTMMAMEGTSCKEAGFISVHHHEVKISHTSPRLFALVQISKPTFYPGEGESEQWRFIIPHRDPPPNWDMVDA